MKYEEVLKEKNVNKEDLSKTLQTKIDSIGKFIEKVHSAKTPEQALAAKEALDELDTEISKGIKKFNPEVHQRRLASIANINDKKIAEGPKTERKPTKFEQEVEQFEQEEIIEQEEINPNEEVEQFEQEPNPNDDDFEVEVEQEAPKTTRKNKIERIEELQRKAREAEYLKYRQEEEQEDVRHTRYPRRVQEIEQELDADEIRDFQKAKSVKPKGTSLSITLMGIGVFFLTWGTVNYFRTRKG